MAHIIEDRVLEQSTTAGLGAFTLAGAALGFRAFASVCSVSDTVWYYIEAIDTLGKPSGAFEYGIGTYSGANTLTRTTVRGSSNAGAAVDFAAGTKLVGIGMPSTALDGGRMIEEFGILGAGNDAAVLQAAITAVQGTTAFIKIPGNTTIALGTTPVTSAGSVRVVGLGGKDRTYITWASTTMTAWAHTGGVSGGLILEGITFSGPVSCTAGGAISVNGSGGVACAGVNIRDCAFVNGWNQLYMPQAHSWEISGNTFTNYVNYGIYTENTIDQDEGDAYFANNGMFSNGSTAIGIFQAGAGGLKVIGNKIYGGRDGYVMDLKAGAVTSILLIEGNSIEFQTRSGVRLLNTAGTGSFTQAVINANQFAGQPTPILLDDTTGFCVSCTISDNIIGCATGAGTTCAITVTCAPLTKITDNVIYGSGSTVLGISIGSGSFATSEHDNEIYGCVTEVVNDCSNGALPSSNILTLPTWTDAIIITNSGTDAINSIATASNHRNRTVTLMFQSSRNVLSSGNIKLAGGATFAATANDTLTLTCYDGTNWHETGRSVN